MLSVRFRIFCFLTLALFYGLITNASDDYSVLYLPGNRFCLRFGLLDCVRADVNMQSPQVALRLLCVNCNIRIDTLRRHLVFDLDTRVISTICEWNSSVIITEEDYICEACNQLALQHINSTLANDPGASSSTSSTRGHVYVCILCGISLQNRRRHAILVENPSPVQQAIHQDIENRVAPRQVCLSDHICHSCWVRVQRAVLPNIQENIEQQAVHEHQPSSGRSNSQEPVLPVNAGEQAEEVLGTIHLSNYRRAANTASHCAFYGCQNNELRRISDPLRATTLSEHRYYLPKNARICVEHLFGNGWDTLFNSNNSISTFTAEQVEHVFSFVNSFNTFLDFTSLESVERIDDHLFHYWLGINKRQFELLCYEIPRICETHRGILGLGALLIKLRTGDSDDRISQLLMTPRRTLERLIDKVRIILEQDFVPRNLGIQHVTRDQLLQNNLIIPNGIYNQNNDNVIVICDGTYIYLNKSSNYTFQKDTYSLHKYRNLLKPFLLVSTNGYIIDCFGPYKATTSDAEIMTSLFRNENSPLRQFFQNNDIFILDRGFRDSISLLETCGYKAYMPDSLLQGEHQLTTEQANRSRCVTLCRWVVEVVNGYFKRDFKIFRHEYFNVSVPHMMQMFSIAASLLNKFGVRLSNRNEAEEIIQIIRERVTLNNNLADFVNHMNMNRRISNFNNITAQSDRSLIFPRLEYRELILFALGTYQIRQARSYYSEHIRFHGGYRIEICRENINVSEYNLRGSGDNSLIRGKIKSRHISRKIYYVYILIENNISGREGIIEYCCNCLVGKRTIGCCAHIMTLVWYLGWARHQPSILAPAAFLDAVIVREDE